MNRTDFSIAPVNDAGQMTGLYIHVDVILQEIPVVDHHGIVIGEEGR